MGRKERVYWTVSNRKRDSIQHTMEVFIENLAHDLFGLFIRDVKIRRLRIILFFDRHDCKMGGMKELASSRRKYVPHFEVKEGSEDSKGLRLVEPYRRSGSSKGGSTEMRRVMAHTAKLLGFGPSGEAPSPPPSLGRHRGHDWATSSRPYTRYCI